jgi:hypothetical protein
MNLFEDKKYTLYDSCEKCGCIYKLDHGRHSERKSCVLHSLDEKDFCTDCSRYKKDYKFDYCYHISDYKCIPCCNIC